MPSGKLVVQAERHHIIDNGLVALNHQFGHGIEKSPVVREGLCKPFASYGLGR